MLGQEATAEKANDINAIPKLLELLEWRGCLVTVDSKESQNTREQGIHDGGGWPKQTWIS